MNRSYPSSTEKGSNSQNGEKGEKEKPKGGDQSVASSEFDAVNSNHSGGGNSSNINHNNLFLSSSPVVSSSLGVGMKAVSLSRSFIHKHREHGKLEG